MNHLAQISLLASLLCTLSHDAMLARRPYILLPKRMPLTKTASQHHFPTTSFSNPHRSTHSSPHHEASHQRELLSVIKKNKREIVRLKTENGLLTLAQTIPALATVSFSGLSVGALGWGIRENITSLYHLDFFNAAGALTAGVFLSGGSVLIAGGSMAALYLLHKVKKENRQEIQQLREIVKEKQEEFNLTNIANKII